MEYLVNQQNFHIYQIMRKVYKFMQLGVYNTEISYYVGLHFANTVFQYHTFGRAISKFHGVFHQAAVFVWLYIDQYLFVQ